MSFFARLATGVAAVVVAGIVACALFWYAVAEDRSHPQASEQLVVQTGTTFDEIARQLVAGGVIGNTLTFRILARLRDEDAAVRAGEYRFEPHVTQSEVLHALVTGGAQVAAWVTIPEGFTAEQIAERLQSDGFGSSAALRRDFAQETLLVDGARTKGLEGFLFPSTYLMPLGAAPEQIAALLTAQFLKELPRDAASRARALHVSVTQVVTVASLVEREAKSQADRPKIAAVIYNRLRLGMPLQVDATIEYALPQHKSALSFADLRIDSPYNSYVHAGLPPTPIANPGRASLEAAFHPAKSENLYYVYCGNGRHVFAKTLAEHQANVARCLQ
ncbi:MAG: endolytic transglycosylase MltG [Candidatus Cybelea sp.]